jgi:hypothetical protein
LKATHSSETSVCIHAHGATSHRRETPKSSEKVWLLGTETADIGITCQKILLQRFNALMTCTAASGMQKAEGRFACSRGYFHKKINGDPFNRQNEHFHVN